MRRWRTIPVLAVLALAALAVPIVQDTTIRPVPARADALWPGSGICETRPFPGKPNRAVQLCAYGWSESGPDAVRSVTRMIGKRLAPCGPTTCWITTTFQSLTSGRTAIFSETDPGSYDHFEQVTGQDVGSTTCRRGSPGGPTGSVGCSTANTSEVWYYGAQHQMVGNPFAKTFIQRIGARDDQGHAEAWDLVPSVKSGAYREGL